MSTSVACPLPQNTINRGIGYIATSWSLEAVVLVAVAVRVYTRCWLTRSAGSDDVTILISWVLVLTGAGIDQEAFKNGYGQHCAFLGQEQLQEVMKWVYIAWPNGLLSFFFMRASVILFILRLLPRTKVTSKRIVYAAFVLNIIITLLSCISFGVSCRPYSAHWHTTLGSHCSSAEVLTATNLTNGILACVIDVTTACIPALLLWGLQMRRSTKIILHSLFLLGLINAALSIGRAATLTPTVLTNDFSYRVLVPDYFKLVESKLGVVLACGPTIRQFFAHYNREHSFLPSANRPPPESDFRLFRHRVNVRDVFRFGKRDPTREQGLINYERRQTGSDASGVRSEVTDPEDSPLTEIEQRVANRLHFSPV